ncbi:MAG: EF-hand domain-containing protein [Rhodoferax sp.]|nr:EF-hand domain-containing protein [Rhodoferax sp.]
MSTISGVSSAGDAWANMKAQRSQMQAKMFTKVDTDSSGGVDKTELQSLLDDVAKKTGVTNSSNTNELFSKMDSNSDGSLSSDELGQGMESIMPPPPSTMDFAKVRSDSSSASGEDDLFGKVDTDGNGSVSKEEMQSLMKLMDKLASDSGSDSSSSSSSTSSTGSSDVFSKLDTDSDGSLSKAEFEGGRPQGGNGPQGAGGMPPPPPPGGAGSSSASSTTYDPLDTNENGVVSVQERLAGSSSTDPLQALFKAIDTNSDSKINASESDAFIKQLTSQVEAMAQAAQNTDTSASTGSQSKQDSFDLAQLARRAYDQIASGLARQAKGSTLSAVA